MTGGLEKLRRDWEAAKSAWNNDGGPLEKTVEAGERLYFAGIFLIEHLEEIAAIQGRAVPERPEPKEWR